jgi:hypothetical protein
MHPQIMRAPRGFHGQRKFGHPRAEVEGLFNMFGVLSSWLANVISR